MVYITLCSFFFFNDTATTEIYTLSLHDALPIFRVKEKVKIQTYKELIVWKRAMELVLEIYLLTEQFPKDEIYGLKSRSEEHTSELKSRQYLVCRLLLEKKKKYHLLHTNHYTIIS